MAQIYWTIYFSIFLEKISLTIKCETIKSETFLSLLLEFQCSE